MAYKYPHRIMRIIVLTLLMQFAVCANSQTFELTPNGFVDSKNPQNSYVVVAFDGKTQQDIFNMALSALGKTFILPDNRISKVEYSQINLNGIMSDITFINRLGLHLYFDMFYNLILEFKDGKMRINGPIINDIFRKAPDGKQHIYLTVAERGSALSGDLALFKNNGQVNEKKHKTKIETAVNEFVAKIISLMNTKDSDW